MTLCDAGPLLAYIDRDDADHARCAPIVLASRLPLLTTWAALTEAMYLAGARIGWHGQEQLWELIRRDAVQMHELDHDQINRTYELMKKYADVPMDLADATLVAVAEALDLRRVLTLDSDFEVYRMKGRRRFQILP